MPTTESHRYEDLCIPSTKSRSIVPPQPPGTLEGKGNGLCGEGRVYKEDSANDKAESKQLKVTILMTKVTEKL